MSSQRTNPAPSVSSSLSPPRLPSVIRVVCVYDVSDVCDTIGRVVREAPDMELVGSIHSQAWPVQRMHELRPHVVIFDIMKDGARQVGLLWMVATDFPQTRSMVVLDHYASFPIDRLLNAGARGVIPKDSLATRLADAIRVVAAGGLVLWREPLPDGPLRGPMSADGHEKPGETP